MSDFKLLPDFTPVQEEKKESSGTTELSKRGRKLRKMSKNFVKRNNNLIGVLAAILGLGVTALLVVAATTFFNNSTPPEDSSLSIPSPSAAPKVYNIETDLPSAQLDWDSNQLSKDWTSLTVEDPNTTAYSQASSGCFILQTKTVSGTFTGTTDEETSKEAGANYKASVPAAYPDQATVNQEQGIASVSSASGELIEFITYSGNLTDGVDKYSFKTLIRNSVANNTTLAFTYGCLGNSVDESQYVKALTDLKVATL